MLPPFSFQMLRHLMFDRQLLKVKLVAAVEGLNSPLDIITIMPPNQSVWSFLESTKKGRGRAGVGGSNWI